MDQVMTSNTTRTSTPPIPPELIMQVIEMLGGGYPSQLSYFRNTKATADLARLALVSHCFHKLTMPTLYRHVVLRSNSQLRLFARTLVAGKQLPDVISLRLVRLSDQIPHLFAAQEYRSVIKAVSATLQHINISGEFKFSDWRIGKAVVRGLKRLSCLTESVFLSLEVVPWKSFSTIRRLALDIEHIDHGGLIALCNIAPLEQLSVVAPFPTHRLRPPRGNEWLKLPPNLECVVFLVHPYMSPVFLKAWTTMFDSLASRGERPVRIAVRYEYPPPPDYESVGPWDDVIDLREEVWDFWSEESHS